MISFVPLASLRTASSRSGNALGNTESQPAILLYISFPISGLSTNPKKKGGKVGVGYTMFVHTFTYDSMDFGVSFSSIIGKKCIKIGHCKILVGVPKILGN